MLLQRGLSKRFMYFIYFLNMRIISILLLEIAAFTGSTNGLPFLNIKCAVTLAMGVFIGTRLQNFFAIMLLT